MNASESTPQCKGMWREPVLFRHSIGFWLVHLIPVGTDPGVSLDSLTLCRKYQVQRHNLGVPVLEWNFGLGSIRSFELLQDGAVFLYHRGEDSGELRHSLERGPWIVYLDCSWNLRLCTFKISDHSVTLNAVNSNPYRWTLPLSLIVTEFLWVKIREYFLSSGLHLSSLDSVTKVFQLFLDLR